MNKYNGWTNYPTWVVNLWNDGDEYIEEMAAEAWANTESGRHFSHFENARRELADRLKEMVEENTPEATGMYSDIIGWALESVDYFELAEAWLDGFVEEEQDET